MTRGLTSLGALALLAACGCAAIRAPVVPPQGIVFTHYRAPLTTDFDRTTPGPKEGRASTVFVFEPFLGTSYAWDDASVETAAANGGISTVRCADYEWLQVLGCFGQLTVIAYGD